MEKVRFLKLNFKTFSASTLFKLFLLLFKSGGQNKHDFPLRKQSARANLLTINTSQIFFARCQLSDLESPWSQTSRAKIL